MRSLRRRKEEAWSLLSPVGWPEDVGEPLGQMIAGAVDYAAYIASLNPLLWLRLRETSGTTAVNSGSLGAAADGTIAGTTTLGQTGQLGANEAFLYDGLTSLITIPALTGYNNLTAFTWGLLCNPTSAGESNAGRLITAANGAVRAFGIASVNRELSFFNTSTLVAANSTTANGFLALATWQYFFVTFDNAGDRKARIYKTPAAGVLTEATYVTQDAMTGTILLPSVDLTIGNNAAQTLTFNGLIDDAFIIGSVLSEAQMTQIGVLAGLAA